MTITALNVVIGIWLALLAVWIVGAMTAKRTVRREVGPARLGQLALNLTTWMLMTWHRGPAHSVLNARAVPDTFAVHAIGLALTLGGAAFTLWARATIGRNWSGNITVKTDHQLMTRGPYAIVRHPIYSGLLLTLVGTAVVVGEYRSFAAVGFALAGWKWKSLTEERVMTEQFGDVYRDYQRRVKALVPFVV